MKLTRSWRLTLSLLFLVLCALWGAGDTLHLLPEYHGVDVRGGDADSNYFVDAWNETPHFSDTMKWWYGPWGQKFRPFYRPLASLFFWTQYQIFGLHGKFAFTAMLLLWHFVALFVAWRFLHELLGELSATLSAGAWAAGLLTTFAMPSPLPALQEWKDTVESWHAVPYLVCLWCFLSLLRGEQARHKWLALFWFWVALLIKEMAYTLPVMLMLLAWHEGKLRDRWREVVPFFALAAAMVLFRLWALQGTGFRMGSNGQWYIRFLADMGGGPFTRLLHHDFLTLAPVCAALALWQATQRQWWRVSAWLAATCLQLAVTAHCADMAFDEVASRLLVPAEWRGVFYLAALTFLWWRCLQRKNRHQVFGVLWAVIAYLPLLSGPNTSHVLYFVSIGWAIWLAYALLDVAELLRGALASHKLERQPQTA